MSNLNWDNFESLIPTDGIESLRGDKDFIAFIKEDIKLRSKATSVYNRAHRKRQSQMDRGLEVDAMPDRAYWTSSSLMRHIFLAYAWLRYKPFSKTEPDAKEFRDEPWRIPLADGTLWPSKYNSHKTPDPRGIAQVIEWYVEQYEKKQEVPDAASA
jgi:hypothetical protein